MSILDSMLENKRTQITQYKKDHFELVTELFLLISDVFLLFIFVLIVLLYLLNKKLDTIPPHSNWKADPDDEELLTSTEYTTDYTSNDVTPYSSEYSSE